MGPGTPGPARVQDVPRQFVGNEPAVGLRQRKRLSFESLLPQGDGGGGGNRTRVRKPYIPGPTCLAVFLILVVHYPSGREDDRPAQERFSEPALSTLDTRACERVPRVWMHKHTPVGG